MFELYSQRIKNSEGEPEVYIYDFFPDKFRNQIFYIINDAIDPYGDELWETLYYDFAREKGVKNLIGSPFSNTEKSEIEYYVSDCSSLDLLDLLDYIFNRIDYICRNSKPDTWRKVDLNARADQFIYELNNRLKQHNLGYEFINGEIIRIDNKILHQAAIKPSLKLLFENGFEGAEQEFLNAFKYRRDGDYKNAILEALKSFESTMKTICDKKGYHYDKSNDTANKLIKILESNDFYPSYLTNHLTGLRTSLESGLPTLRNKKSGHGQGSSVVNVSEEFAEYALNLAATNIVLLVKLFISSY